jgi:hypothetical protein
VILVAQHDLPTRALSFDVRPFIPFVCNRQIVQFSFHCKSYLKHIRVLETGQKPPNRSQVSLRSQIEIQESVNQGPSRSCLGLQRRLSSVWLRPLTPLNSWFSAPHLVLSCSSASVVGSRVCATRHTTLHFASLCERQVRKDQPYSASSAIPVSSGIASPITQNDVWPAQSSVLKPAQFPVARSFSALMPIQLPRGTSQPVRELS